MKAKVNNIFYSVQGEGTVVGKPCIFVRFSGCTLNCKWCDTKYHTEYKEMTVAQIVNKIKKYPCNLVEFTGGEPLLHKDVIIEVIKKLGPLYTNLIETNNTLPLDLPDIADIHYIVDIKCPSSGCEFDGSNKIQTLNLHNLDYWNEIKFVVEDETDLVFAQTVISEHLIEFRGVIIFSPVFGKMKLERLVQFIKTLGRDTRVRMQLQLHKLIWPVNKRGV